MLLKQGVEVNIGDDVIMWNREKKNIYIAFWKKDRFHRLIFFNKQAFR